MNEERARNNFTSLEGELKPRELMERAASPCLVSDEALLAILLKTGAQGLNVVELSRRLIDAFGSLKTLVSADWRTLETKIADYNEGHPDKRILGIGHVKCLELAAAFEMGRRWARMSPEEIKQVKVDDAESAYQVFRAAIHPDGDRENVYVLLLDAKCHPLCEPLTVACGEGSSSVFSPKELFKEAVRWGAHAVVIAHNHPSGNPEPSEEDLALTRRINAVADVMSIPVVDHIVIGAVSQNNRDRYVSIRDSHPEVFESSCAVI